MFCSRCGTQANNKRYCTQCGAALLKIQASLAGIAAVSGRMQFAAAQAIVSSGNIPATYRQPSAALQTIEKPSGLMGRTLDQKYDLETIIGIGGMGTVYRAFRKMIGDNVAIKILHPDQATDTQSVERFKREAQTAARLKHPNLVRIYDFGMTKDGLLYQVMELAEGESLRQLIERKGRLSEKVAVEIASQICAALEIAHKNGVVHRDIKPENILVQTTSGGMQVKVLDFGIAALRGIPSNRLTHAGSFVGTPYYMSPEHCLGDEQDGRSDIYSLGILLFEMLTGLVPFNSSVATAVGIQQVKQLPPSLRELNPHISPAVEAVVLRALEKSPEARQQTASELARDLNSAVKGVKISISGSTVTNRGSEMTTSNKSKVKSGLFVLGMLLMLVAVVGGGSWKYKQRSANAKVTITSETTKVSQNPAPIVQNPISPVMATVNEIWEPITDQTVGTSAADNLDFLDRKAAVIEPGGQLALDYRERGFFDNRHGIDLRVHGPQDQQVSYLIFVRSCPTDRWEWIDVNRKGFHQGVAGHDMGHHGIRQGRQVMIRNTGNADLMIDALSVVK